MRVWSLIATIILGSLASTAVAQAPAAGQAASGQNAAGQAATPPSAPISIGVVDVGYLLKNHPTMKSEIEAIEAQMKAADDAMSQKRDSILKQMEELREKYVEGTREYEAEEKRIAAQDTEFRLELVKKRKEFDTARANVLVKVYADITYLVKYYCDNTGIQVVLRVTREKMDAQKPETVQMVMSQDVLYFNERTDMTKWVLDALQSRTGSTANASAGAGAGAGAATRR